MATPSSALTLSSRYLQESGTILLGLAHEQMLKLKRAGYGDAAVKLQRDWNVNADGLPFAKHIQGQALVNLVQKGLKYHHLQLTIDEASHVMIVPRTHR